MGDPSFFRRLHPLVTAWSEGLVLGAKQSLGF